MNDAMDVNMDMPTSPPPALERHAFCLGFAQAAAGLSRDPSTQVGCALVGDTGPNRFQLLAHGYNRFPEGVEYTPDRLNSRPDKYMFTLHAERNALNNLLRNTMAGGPILPMSRIAAYIWGMSPCTECVKDLIDAGITRIYYNVGNSSPEARERYAIGATSQAIMNEAIVRPRVVELAHVTPIQFTPTEGSSTVE